MFIIMDKNHIQNLIENKIRQIIKENREQQQMLRNKLAQEILGTPTFEDFYKNTGFWVSARSYELMQEYFRRLKEETAKLENNIN